MMLRSFNIILTLLVFTVFSQAQMQIHPESKLWLEGNSTIHENSAKASEISGSIAVDSMLFIEGKGNLSTLFQHADITIPVKKMLSGNEKLDNNMYDALKADDYPNIIFHLTKDSIISNANKDSLIIGTAGTLAVAGKEKNIEMTVAFLKHHDGTLGIKGSKELLMTDFDIEPPSMMFGVVKTDNKVVIRFDLLLKSRYSVSQQ